MSSARNQQNTISAADPAREFLDFWRNYFEQTAIQTRLLLENVEGGKSLDQLHSQMLGTLSENLETFMRTPVFLEVLKQSLRRMIDLKLAQDQIAQSAASQASVPLAAEVAGIFERVQRAEQAILARLVTMEDRLKAIETTLQVNLAEKNPKRRREPTTGTKDDARGGPAG